MPYLDSTDGEWYQKQVISICHQARQTDIDGRIFTLDGALHADSKLVLEILTILRTFLDCCRPYKDNTYVKVTVVNQALRLALVAIVDAEGCEIIKERIGQHAKSHGHGAVSIVYLDSMDPVERAATMRLIAL
ncbi:hypothetical protein MMC34_006172 [Xylographa carneopallida]|nr:hypothetical protein [Xylographa carneopallida]